ncbi:MAG TPA: hypothetical protein VF458_11385, partial [Ktedonobacteraceae bacterium]
MKKVWCGFACFALVVLLAACSSPVVSQSLPSRPLTSDAINHNDSQQKTMAVTPTPPMSISSQQATPTPKPSKGSGSGSGSNSGSASCVTFSNDATHVPAKNGGLAAPY